MIGNYYPYQYCREPLEKIENYNMAINDKEKLWVLHHKRETHDQYGYIMRYFLKADDLKAMGLYYCRPAREFVFLPEEEHKLLHKHKGFYFHSEWSRVKLKRQHDYIMQDKKRREYLAKQKKPIEKKKKLEKMIYVKKLDKYMTVSEVKEYCKKNLEELKKSTRVD